MLNWIPDFIKDFAAEIWDMLSAAITYLADLLTMIFWGIIVWAHELAFAIISAIFDLIPDHVFQNSAEALDLLARANSMIPIDHFFIAVSTYLAFVIVFITSKMILKLIPTIG